MSKIIGAIAGDIIGSRFEFNNHKSKFFRLFTRSCFATDDSIMTLAVAKALLEWKKLGGNRDNLSKLTVKCMQEVGRPYPYCGYGGKFLDWMYSNNPQPYNSFGNGAAMRVSPVAYVAASRHHAEQLADAVTAVTHNHPEGMKGARATAAATWMALNGYSKVSIRSYIQEAFYSLDFTLNEIRPTYQFNETCQETVPQAIVAFLESTSYEDAIRNAISIGGDSDTLAAITGAIAGAYYGVPRHIYAKAIRYLDPHLLKILNDFEVQFT